MKSQEVERRKPVLGEDHSLRFNDLTGIYYIHLCMDCPRVGAIWVATLALHNVAFVGVCHNH